MKVDRREFIKLCQALGLALPLSPLLNANGSVEHPNDAKNKSVTIIGAGAAGLLSGYLLKQQGINVQILEASPYHGGRMKHTTEFADFPISLGAEWIHVKPSILDEMVNDDAIDINIATTKYNPKEDWGLYKGQRISLRSFGFTKDSKFINSSWLDFFESYIVPSVDAEMTYNQAVERIDYSGSKIQVKTQNTDYLADYVIVSAPVKILQEGMITFVPELPRKKQTAIDKVRVWKGCKAFIEFSEKFYPTFVGFDVTPSTAGQKLYYDASYGQKTNQHILGLFAVGTAAQTYTDLSDDALVRYILNELDELFEGKATASYIKHRFQNWNDEPYAKGAYVVDDENWRVVRRLGESVDERIFFAGDAYTDGSDWGSVHAAAYSAKRAVRDILNAV